MISGRAGWLVFCGLLDLLTLLREVYLELIKVLGELFIGVVKIGVPELDDVLYKGVSDCLKKAAVVVVIANIGDVIILTLFA